MKKTAVVLSCLLIAALCVIAYANALGGKFVWDDYILIKNNPYISKWSYAVKALTENINAGQQAIGFSYRPTQLIIYIALNSVWGQNELP